MPGGQVRRDLDDVGRHRNARQREGESAARQSLRIAQLGRRTAADGHKIGREGATAIGPLYFGFDPVSSIVVPGRIGMVQAAEGRFLGGLITC